MNDGIKERRQDRRIASERRLILWLCYQREGTCGYGCFSKRSPNSLVFFFPLNTNYEGSPF